MSDDSDESDVGIAPMPKVKPNPFSSQGPYVLPPIQRPIQRPKIETLPDHHTSSSEETSDDPGVEDPYHPTSPPPAADRGGRSSRGRGRGAGAGSGAGPHAGSSAGPSAGTPAGPSDGRGGRAHRTRVMGSTGARANAAALNAALAAELARNNVGGLDVDTPNANADEQPGPFDKLNKMDHKHLVRKCDIQYRMNRLVSTLNQN